MELNEDDKQSRFADAAKKMDEDIDRFMESLAKRGKNDDEKAFDFDKWCKEIDKHPAFARELKPTEDDGQYSVEMQALQAMKYDEDDPAECANAYKEEGNRHFEKRNYRWSIDAYTKGIKMSCADLRLNSVLFANRAAANRRLGNVRSAFKDCFFARRFDSANLKAIRRGAECLLELGEAAKCISWIDSDKKGEVTPTDGDEQLEKLRRKAEAMRTKEDRDERRERAQVSAERRGNAKLLEALKARGIRLCPPVEDADELCQQLLISFGPLERHSMVRLSEEGTENEQLIWPILLQYPESGQTDFVAECAEKMLLSEALSEVFSSPAHWDFSHQFRFALVQFLLFECFFICLFGFDNVRFFVGLFCADGEERIREILPEKHSIGVVLRWSDVFVTGGLPVIQVYTKQHLEHNKLKPFFGGCDDIFHFQKE